MSAVLRGGEEEEDEERAVATGARFGERREGRVQACGAGGLASSREATDLWVTGEKEGRLLGMLQFLSICLPPSMSLSLYE